MLTPIMSKNVAKGVKSTAQGKTPKLPLNDQVGCTLFYTRLLIFFHTNIIISINQKASSGGYPWPKCFKTALGPNANGL